MRVETTSEIFVPSNPRVPHEPTPLPAAEESALPAPSSRTIAPNAGGCAGESSGFGRSVNKVAGVATLTSQPHPYLQRTGRRLVGYQGLCVSMRTVARHAHAEPWACHPAAVRVPSRRLPTLDTWTLDFLMSRPDLRSRVGSRISWVIFLSKIRDPTPTPGVSP
jgi:hypothetical protein